MQTLFEKVTECPMDPLDALDIALQLCYRIESTYPAVHLDPMCIRVGEDNIIIIDEGDHPADCLYASPDTFLEGAPASRESMYFSLGCLMYFMLNGKNYYDANGLDPFETIEGQAGSGLIEPAVYSGRAWEAICGFTAWNPAGRTAGMTELIKLMDKVTATVTVRYLLEGRPVHTEQINIKQDMYSYRSGQRIEAADHTVYTILPGADIKFRPGHHSADVPVSKPENAGIPTGGTPVNVIPSEPEAVVNSWLVIRFPNPDGSGRPIFRRVAPITDEKWGVKVEISMLTPVRYNFLEVQTDVAGNVIGRRELFHLDIPAAQEYPKACFHVVHHVNPKGFSVVLADLQGNYISNAQHFQLK